MGRCSLNFSSGGSLRIVKICEQYGDKPDALAGDKDEEKDKED